MRWFKPLNAVSLVAANYLVGDLWFFFIFLSTGLNQNVFNVYNSSSNFYDVIKICYFTLSYFWLIRQKIVEADIFNIKYSLYLKILKM